METLFHRNILCCTPLMLCRRVAQQEPCCARWFLIQCIQGTQWHMWVARPHGIHAVLNGGMNAHVWRWHGLFCSSATLVSLRADEYIHQARGCVGVVLEMRELLWYPQGRNLLRWPSSVTHLVQDVIQLRRFPLLNVSKHSYVLSWLPDTFWTS
jgi:hypothetical protein